MQCDPAARRERGQQSAREHDPGGGSSRPAGPEGCTSAARKHRETRSGGAANPCVREGSPISCWFPCFRVYAFERKASSIVTLNPPTSRWTRKIAAAEAAHAGKVADFTLFDPPFRWTTPRDSC